MFPPWKCYHSTKLWLWKRGEKREGRMQHMLAKVKVLANSMPRNCFQRGWWI